MPRDTSPTLEKPSNPPNGSASIAVTPPGERRRAVTARAVEFGILAAFVVLLIIAITGVNGFTTGYNVRAVLTDSAFVGIVAVGMTFVVVSGNYIDLSVVAQVAASAVHLPPQQHD